MYVSLHHSLRSDITSFYDSINNYTDIYSMEKNKGCSSLMVLHFIVQFKGKIPTWLSNHAFVNHFILAISKVVPNLVNIGLLEQIATAQNW
jgi:hypothetical protein